MEIQHKESEKYGSFFVESEGKKLARLDYTPATAGLITITHTEVDPSLKGMHMGVKLVNKAVDFARANNLKIIPECPFARSVMEKKPEEYGDIIYK